MTQEIYDEFFKYFDELEKLTLGSKNYAENFKAVIAEKSDIYLDKLKENNEFKNAYNNNININRGKFMCNMTMEEYIWPICFINKNQFYYI